MIGKYLILCTQLKGGFPGSSAGKESTCNEGDPGSIPGLGRSPGGGHGNPVQYSCLEHPHRQRNLEGTDTKEQLSTHTAHTTQIHTGEISLIM